MANKDRLPPIHPGEILREEFLSPLGMSAHQVTLAALASSVAASLALMTGTRAGFVAGVKNGEFDPPTP